MCFSEDEAEYISVTITPDNKFIVSGSSNKTIKIWDILNKKGEEFKKDAHKSWIISVAVTSDNKYLISGSRD